MAGSTRKRTFPILLAGYSFRFLQIGFKVLLVAREVIHYMEFMWDSIKIENVDLGAIKEYRSVIEICSELHDFHIYHNFLSEYRF